MTAHKKITISLATLAVLGLFGYYVVSQTPIVRADVVTTSIDSSAPIGQDILDLLTLFNSVSIDPAFFSSALFQNLRDFSITLPIIQEGRANPFAPIGNESGIVSQPTFQPGTTPNVLPTIPKTVKTTSKKLKR